MFGRLGSGERGSGGVGVGLGGLELGAYTVLDSASDSDTDTGRRVTLSLTHCVARPPPLNLSTLLFFQIWKTP